MVLRRPPRGVSGGIAHDVAREYGILAALHPLGVPVPRPLVKCDEPSVIGAPFYLMEHVRGVILRGAAPSDMVRALTSIPDTRAIPVLLDLLDAKEAWLVEDVAVALKRAGATGFVDRIARRIPPTVDEAESIAWLADMLDAVREVDAPLAEKLVRERFLDNAPLNAERQWVRQLPR